MRALRVARAVLYLAAGVFVVSAFAASSGHCGATNAANFLGSMFFAIVCGGLGAASHLMLWRATRGTESSRPRPDDE